MINMVCLHMEGKEFLKPRVGGGWFVGPKSIWLYKKRVCNNCNKIHNLVKLLGGFKIITNRLKLCPDGIKVAYWYKLMFHTKITLTLNSYQLVRTIILGKYLRKVIRIDIFNDTLSFIWHEVQVPMIEIGYCNDTII